MLNGERLFTDPLRFIANLILYYGRSSSFSVGYMWATLILLTKIQRWTVPSTKVPRYFFSTITGTISTWYRTF